MDEINDITEKVGLNGNASKKMKMEFEISEKNVDESNEYNEDPNPIHIKDVAAKRSAISLFCGDRIFSRDQPERIKGMNIQDKINCFVERYNQKGCKYISPGALGVSLG